MYYQNYEDYMRSVLGYPMENRNTYGMEMYAGQFNDTTMYRDTKELESCYPEIYKIINQIVCEVCDRHSNATTRDEVENMVEEVYQRVIVNNEIAIKINIENRSTDKEENRENNVKTNFNRNANNEPVKQTREVENRQRRPNNPLLRDLIRILILNRLLGGFFPGRPPRPRPPFTGPGRPPFTGGSGGMMRPPMQRDYDDYLKF